MTDIKALDAAAMGFQVKPLVWGKDDISNDTPWGQYWIADRHDNDMDDQFGWSFTSRGDWDDSEDVYLSKEAAKAAAQADYEARVLSTLIPTPPTPDVAEAARVILDNRWGGYGNRGAMHAMWNFIHDERDARPFPVSFYDGVFQAALAALAEGRG